MSDTEHRDDRFYLTRKAHALGLRASFLQSLRRRFAALDFLEVETPVRVPSPAPEEHIEALPAGDWFLQTSPELGMKRLIAAGFPRIFQICKCFRAGERGARHLPEFTLLEWYVAGFDYRDLMDQCEALLIAVLKEMGHDRHLVWQNRRLTLTAPWERVTVADAFARYAPVKLEKALADQQFDEMLTEHVEPRLGCDRPTFLYDYPAPMAALARVKKSDPSVAERFELYIAGLEIANGFSELTDAAEQRQRFEEALRVRARKNWAPYRMPEKFLDALAVMPDAAGIALGIDRMVMLLAAASSIDDVVAFPPETL
ncbi:MAG: EF-P lysine aminoacylase EpmA [Smithellaceae bacterium]|nr:EF-P lysine aminoacylase GenX [Syntrophaceae bacterium]MDD4242308.1 EF-P lysine aminoacylase EpmA [Smithellaceae bacterium]NLX51566.1 EF-P lysine aminoacylase GenX [Deltaproteobacteria bacterium]